MSASRQKQTHNHKTQTDIWHIFKINFVISIFAQINIFYSRSLYYCRFPITFKLKSKIFHLI